MTAYDCDVVVRDIGVDAALAESESGRPLLILRPMMSRGAAVQAVMGVLPSLSADEASRIVRQALPGAPDLDDIMAPQLDAVEVVTDRCPPRRVRWARTAVMCGVSAGMAAVAVTTIRHAGEPSLPLDSTYGEMVTVMPMDGNPSKQVCVSQSRVWSCDAPEGIRGTWVRIKSDVPDAPGGGRRGGPSGAAAVAVR